LLDFDYGFLGLCDEDDEGDGRKKMKIVEFFGYD